jgi:hypothetical protein
MADAALKSFMVTSIKSTVAQCIAGGDKNVSYYFFTKQYHAGCDGHPSLEEHEEIAKELAQYLSL